MSNISTVIKELLFERDSVIVPGLGMFVRHYDGARVNVITNTFKKPTATITFDPQQRGEDGILVTALAAYEGCSEEEARQNVTQFVAHCFAELKSERIAELPGFGKLVMDERSMIYFEQDEDVNLNGDAFGLENITPTPVYSHKSDKPANKKTYHDDVSDEESYHKQHRRAVLWTVMSVLMVIPVVLALLYFLEVIHFDFHLKPQPQQPPRVYVQPDSSVLAQMADYYPARPPEVEETPETETIPEVEETPETETIPEIEKTPEPEKAPVVEQTPEPASPSGGTSRYEVKKYSEILKTNIIAGCFSQLENAENMLTLMHEQGFDDAFIFQKGKMYYVSYGGYASMDEAKAALSVIKTNPDNKAWILNK
ncbi:MAG: SPOR domain-containing protein [Bacteroidales bacterium]|nr:SPOR domain-containing protein [Bacteroidales bacterium]